MRPDADRFDSPSPRQPAGPGGEPRPSGGREATARRRPVRPSGPAAHDLADAPARTAPPLRRHPRRDPGVEGNARLTGATAAVLLVLFALEGLTLPRINSRVMLTAHIVLGMVVVPPVLVKVGSTSWRFLRYYTRRPAYRRRGTPPLLLRVLGPVLVVLTVVMLASGILLVLLAGQVRHALLLVHKVSFVLWFAVMIVHVVGHFVEMSQLAPRDFVARTRRRARGASLRVWLVTASLVVGIALGAAIEPSIGPWLASGGIYPH